MTSIEFNFTKPDGSPDTGTVTFTPTRRNRHGEGVSLPEPFAVPLTDQGAFSVDLKPTPAHWLWRITTQVGTHPWDTSYFYVPDRNFPLRYEDLTPVDPSTVQTGLNPEPAWWAALDSAGAAADEIAELTFQARSRIGDAQTILAEVEQVRDDALNQIQKTRELSARNLNRSEEILHEIQNLYTDIVGSST